MAYQRIVILIAAAQHVVHSTCKCTNGTDHIKATTRLRAQLVAKIVLKVAPGADVLNVGAVPARNRVSITSR